MELLKRRERGDYRGRGGKGAIRSSTTPWPGRSGDGSVMGNYDELDCYLVTGFYFLGWEMNNCRLWVFSILFTLLEFMNF